MKNESHLIEEWLDHYLSQGADRIFLIDNGSTDDTVAKVQPWLQDGCVQLIHYAEKHQQELHYWNAFCHFNIHQTCDWLGIADIDEFWFCKSGERLADHVARQSRWDALYVRWTNFGSAGHEAQPDSVRRRLIRHDPDLGGLPKYIFRTFLPQRARDIQVHFVRNVMFWRTRIAEHELQLNHYIAQSRDYWFKVKLTRGSAAQLSRDLSGKFEMINAASTATCTRLRDLVEAGFWKR